jgi:hypothetical protein
VIKKDARAGRRVEIQVKYRCEGRLRRQHRDPGLHLLRHRRLSSGIVGVAYIRFAQFATEMVKTRGDFGGSKLQ